MVVNTQGGARAGVPSRVENLKEISAKIRTGSMSWKPRGQLERKDRPPLGSLQKPDETYQKQTERMRFGNVAYRAGDHLGRRVQRGNLAQTESDLLSFDARQPDRLGAGAKSGQAQLRFADDSQSTSTNGGSAAGEQVRRQGHFQRQHPPREPVVVHSRSFRQALFKAGEVIFPAVSSMSARVPSRMGSSRCSAGLTKSPSTGHDH